MSNGMKVSVIIPTYKRANYLHRAIDSVINQRYINIEVLVVDDNDPNTVYRGKTKEIMDRYTAFNNVFYIKHRKNKGGSAARNTGFRASTGDYIMYLDDDDEMLPDKVAEQVKCLNNLDKSWGLCYTNYIRKNNGKIIYYSAERREGYLLVDALMRNLFVHAGCNLMIRREVVEEVNGFDETFIRNQDIEFLVRVLKKYKIAYVDNLGLIKHFEDRQTHNVTYNEITSHYIDKFKPLIETLPHNEKRKVYTMFQLQHFRHDLIKKKDIKSALLYVREKNIPFHLIIKYVFYLINRKVSKKVYGFKI